MLGLINGLSPVIMHKARIAPLFSLMSSRYFDLLPKPNLALAMLPIPHDLEVDRLCLSMIEILDGLCCCLPMSGVFSVCSSLMP